MAESQQVTPEAVASVAGKLQEFAEGLPEQERSILGWVVKRAAEVTKLVTGEAAPTDFAQAEAVGNLEPGFQSQLARAVGFTEQAGPEGTLAVQAPGGIVAWSW
jgi:hypothetical protein